MLMGMLQQLYSHDIINIDIEILLTATYIGHVADYWLRMAQ